MDVASVAQMLFKMVQDNPELLQKLTEHPYSTTADACGIQGRISQQDMSQVVTLLASLLGGGTAMSASNATAPTMDGTDALVSMASQLLGSNGNSVHTLAKALLGGMASGAGQGGAGIDLSDGIGLDDVIGIASKLL